MHPFCTITELATHRVSALNEEEEEGRQASVEAILLHCSAIWSLTISEETRLDGCYTRMLKVYNINGLTRIAYKKLYKGLSCLCYHQGQMSLTGRAHPQRQIIASLSHHY